MGARNKPLPSHARVRVRAMLADYRYQGNMYLAEDRILCFELIARQDCSWTMHYVKDAKVR